MNTIRDYLEQMKSYVLRLKGDISVIEEYESHLSAEFEYFQKNNPNIDKDIVESEYVSHLEHPAIIAKSLVLEEVDEGSIIEKKDNLLIKIGESGFMDVFISLSEKVSNISKIVLRDINPLLLAVLYSIIFHINICLLYILNFKDLSALTYQFPSGIFYFPWFKLFHLNNTLIYIMSFIIIPLLVVFLVGWNRSIKEIILFALFFGLLSLTFNSLFSLPQRLSNFEYYSWNGGYTEDWLHITVPSLLEIIIHVLDFLFIKQFLGASTFIFIIGMIGFIAKHLKNTSFKSNIKSCNKTIIIKISSLMFCIIFLITIISNYQDLPRYYFSSIALPAPPTPEKTPLFYYFQVYSQKGHLSDSITSKIVEFGNLSINGDSSRFKVSLNTSDLSQIEPTITAIMNTYHRKTGTDSEFAFPIFGTLYLPSKYANQSWFDYIKDYSTIFSIKGFNIEAIMENTSIKWLINRNNVRIPVNTISYSSLTDDSIYTLHFDKKTGWLMKAIFKKDGSWTKTEICEFLSVQRLFKEENISSMTDAPRYKTVDLIISMPIFIISTCLVTISAVYYKIKR